MRSKSQLLLVLLGLLLAGGVGWLLLADSDSEALAIARAGQSDSLATERGESELSTPKEANAQRDEAPIAEEAAAPKPKAVSYADSSWVEGRVVFPGGTPVDERVTVVARGKKFKGKQEDPRKFEAMAEESGRFRVAFAKKTKRGKLSLKAKYLYLHESVSVAVREPDNEPLLKPALGGCIEVKLIPPTETPLSEEELESIDLVAWVPADIASVGSVSAKRVEGATFQIGGVPPGHGYSLQLSSDHFPDLQDEGIVVKAGEVAVVELQLELGARVMGRVVDDNGKPVSGAELSYRSGDSWEAGRTNDDGEFNQGGLRPGELLITVSKSGYLETESEPVAISAGETVRDLELLIRQGNSVAGVVLWSDGAPATGAKVTLRQDSDAVESRFYVGSIERTKTVDAEGSFSFTGLGNKECVVSARAQEDLERTEGESKFAFRRRKKQQGYSNALNEHVAPDDAQLTLVLEAGAGIRGVVLDDQGVPLEKFRVVATLRGDSPWDNPEGGKVTLNVRDSADGSFELRGLGEGEFEVRASAKGHLSRERQPIDIPWNGEELQLVLPRAASLSGRVLDLDGKAVPRASVIYNYEDGQRNMFFGNGNKQATADEDGTFSFGSLAAGPGKVRATAPGLASSGWMSVGLSPGEERAGFGLALRLGAILTGSIHPSVTPRVGVGIELSSHGPAGHRNTKTDSNGQFRFEGLDPGRYQVVLEADMSDIEKEDPSFWSIRSARGQQVNVELPLGGEEHVVIGVPAEDPILVTGVVSSGGRAVVGRHLSVRNAADYEANKVVTTDAAGLYSVTLDGPGLYQFTIGGSWGAGVEFTEEISAQEAFRLDIELPAASLSGAVRGPTGDPVSNLEITLNPESAAENQAESAGDSRFNRILRKVETDAEGRYKFEHLTPGVYTLRAGGTDRWGMRRGADLGREFESGIQIKEGGTVEGVDVDLRFAGSVNGKVLDSSGAPASDISIRVKCDGGWYAEQWAAAVTDEYGAFTVAGVAPGSVTLVVESEGGNTEERVEVFERRTTDVVLTLR